MRKLLTKEEVEIPAGCEISIDKKIVTIKGKRGTIQKNMEGFNLHFSLDGDVMLIQLWNGNSREQSKVHTASSILRNAIKGIMQGYVYTCKAISKHFPVSVEIASEGKVVILRGFLGEKMIRKYSMLGNSIAKLGTEKNTFVIEGVSLEDVSQSAGKIQENCQVKHLDTRLFLDGVYVISKGVIESN